MNRNLVVRLAAAGMFGMASGLLAAAPQQGSAVTQSTVYSNIDKEGGSARLSTDLKLRTGNYVAGQVLVKFRSSVTAKERDAVISDAGGKRVETIGRGHLEQVTLSSGTSVERAIEQYQSDSRVEYAQPNFIYRASAVPADPRYGDQWGFRNRGQTISSVTQGDTSIDQTNNPGVTGADLNIEPAWDNITDCSTVTVAVVDTGINYNHEELFANMWNGGVSAPNHGWNFVEDSNDPMDTNGHGTHVAGIIGAAGNNRKGGTGACWKASLMAVRVLDNTGTGTTALVVEGIDYAVQNGAKVINMSLGSGGGWDGAFSAAIDRARSAGVLVVVAAGNSASDVDSESSEWPCNFSHDNLICVAATDQADQLTWYSNFGANSVDVGAPGANILSTWPGTSTITDDPLDQATGGWYGNGAPTNDSWYYAANGGLVSSYYYGTYYYSPGVDSQVFKTYVNSDVDAALLTFTDVFNVADGDCVSVRLSAVPDENPFIDPAADVLASCWTGHYGSYEFFDGPYDMSSCIAGGCALGFQLKSDPASPGDVGVAITSLSIETLTLNATSYNTLSGTSMASPAVAGIAALIWAYNPAFTYSDVIDAIENGGRPVAALTGITRTGKIVDAIGALSYIKQPTGLAANVH